MRLFSGQQPTANSQQPAVRLLALTLVLACPLLTSCVRRTISITSEPSGALVWLNDREVGRTPVDVDFVHYGTYDVRLVREGYEPLTTAAKAEAPLWDLPGPDLVAELIPGEVHAQVEWHFEMEPLNEDSEALVDRAEDLRARALEEPFPDPE